MQLILTSPPKVMVIVKEISFNYGSPGLMMMVVLDKSLKFIHVVIHTVIKSPSHY